MTNMPAMVSPTAGLDDGSDRDTMLGQRGAMELPGPLVVALRRQPVTQGRAFAEDPTEP